MLKRNEFFKSEWYRSIGASVTIGAYILPKLVAAFKKETPGLRVEVIEDTTLEASTTLANPYTSI